MFEQLADEHGVTELSYSTVRDYVRRRRPELDIEAGRLPEVFVPQEQAPGAEAEVDFREVWVILVGVMTVPALLRPPYQAAGFPRDKWLGDFDFEANPNINPATINNLATAEGVRRGQALCLIGDSGTGGKRPPDAARRPGHSCPASARPTPSSRRWRLLVRRSRPSC